MKTKPPTHNQLAVWDALDAVTLRDRRQPTIREVQMFLGWSSISYILQLLREGVAAGRVATWPRDGKTTSYVPVWFQQAIDEAIAKQTRRPADMVQNPEKVSVDWHSHPVFSVGRMANETGVPREDCPYPRSSMAAANLAWHAGWDEAEEEERLAGMRQLPKLHDR